MAHEPLEVLAFREELTSVWSFEFALRERVGRFSSFQSEHFACVRAVERLGKDGATLALISDHVQGIRLSEILALAETRLPPVDTNAALCLIRQLVSAVAQLHKKPELWHGAIAPERIIVTPNARVVIVEHVLGAAIEQLRYPCEQYWKELRVAMPKNGTGPQFDRRTDITQVGAVALALLIGRAIAVDEYPMRIGEMIDGTLALSGSGNMEPLPAPLREWLTRSLQLEPRNPFPSAVEARAELDRVLYYSDPLGEVAALESFLKRHQASAGTEPVKAGAASSAALPPRPAAVPPRPAGAPRPTSPAPAAASAPPSSSSFGVSPAPATPFMTQPPRATTPPAQTVTTPYNVTTPLAAATSRTPATPNAAATPYTSPAPYTRVTPPVTTPVAAPAPSVAPHRLMPQSDPPASTATSPVREEEHSFDFNESEEVDSDMEKSAGMPRSRLIAAAVVLIALTSGVTIAGRKFFMAAEQPAATGTLAVQTNPPGVPVVIDGKQRGATPLSVALEPGQHSLELVTEGDVRSVPITITPGGQVSQFIELPHTPSAFGELQIRTDPAGAQVSLDGRTLGKSPLTAEGLAPGQHTVVLENELGAVTQKVNIEAGATASLMVPLTASRGAGVSGWIAVNAAVDVQLYENQRLLGSSQTDRIMVPVGRHDLEIVNETLGFKVSRVVNVLPGQVATLKVDIPKAAVALNAVPWAEAWVDGERIGETPIGSVPLTIGPHEVVFRHPELGEKRVVTTVTLGTPAKVTVDMTKK